MIDAPEYKQQPRLNGPPERLERASHGERHAFFVIVIGAELRTGGEVPLVVVLIREVIAQCTPAGNDTGRRRRQIFGFDGTYAGPEACDAVRACIEIRTVEAQRRTNAAQQRHVVEREGGGVREKQKARAASFRYNEAGLFSGANELGAKKTCDAGYLIFSKSKHHRMKHGARRAEWENIRNACSVVDITSSRRRLERPSHE